MSYIKDKENMQKEAAKHKKNMFMIIKITFATIAVLLLLFCVALVVSLITGGGKKKDVTPPTVTGRDGGKTVGYVGDKPLYREMVNISDDSDGELTVEINESGVNINKVGEYKVHYRVTDEAGNSTIYTHIYVVKNGDYRWEKLEPLIAEKAAELGITKDMSKKEQVRAIYRYVNSADTVYFTNESNIPDIDRNNWRTDWVEEAIRTLEEESGDCYSYYSLSKAFFKYFDIDEKGIKRSPASEEEGTHFWSVVKVEEGWYYYDATRLAGSFDDGSRNACLITQAKLDSYETSKGGTEFYLMEKSYISGIKISTKTLD